LPHRGHNLAPTGVLEDETGRAYAERLQQIVRVLRQGHDQDAGAGQFFCASTSAGQAHCGECQRLLATQGNPDGHCLLEGACPRYAAARAD